MNENFRTNTLMLKIRIYLCTREATALFDLPYFNAYVKMKYLRQAIKVKKLIQNINIWPKPEQKRMDLINFGQPCMLNVTHQIVLFKVSSLNKLHKTT